MGFEAFKRFLQEDDGLFYEFLPYSSIGSFWIPEGTIYEDVYRRLPLGRLSNVASLVALSYFPELAGNKSTVYLPLSHTRMDHSLCVGKGMELVFERNGFDQGTVEKAAFIGLIHDIATPALGDAAIGVDYALLNEEDNWRESVMPGFAYFEGNYGIREDELDSALHSKGVFGQVLDIVDKIVYVTKDLYALLGHVRPKKLEAFDNLERLVFSPPLIGDALLDVRIKDGTVYSENPEVLGKLLLARAILHRRVYRNPVSQGRDFLLTKMVASLYSSEQADERPLTPQVLRRMDDFSLLSELGRHFDIPAYSLDLTSLLGFWKPSFKMLGSQHDAENYASMLKCQGIPVLGVKKVESFNPGTSFLVKSGDIMPFRDYDSAASLKLERLAASRSGWYVFYGSCSPHGYDNSAVENIIAKLNS